MSINEFKKFLFHPQSFRHITQKVQTLNSYKNPNYKLFEYYQTKKYGELPTSWVGIKHCGDTSFVTKELLLCNNFNNIKVISNNMQDPNDHCFLMNNDIIIDTTYKQFLLDERMGETCKYKEYLFNLPPFFIGTNEMLEETIYTIIQKNEEIYGNSYLNINYLSRYWSNKIELNW
jgi:hypothetical protein